jgi:hypothetical protein
MKKLSLPPRATVRESEEQEDEEAAPCFPCSLTRTRPLLALCAQVPDLGQRIFVGAGWAALPAVGATCHALREFVRTGGTWAAACEALWATKVFVPAAAQQLLKEGRGREACEVALWDATRRRLTVEELQALFWRYSGPSYSRPNGGNTHYRYGAGGAVFAGSSWGPTPQHRRHRWLDLVAWSDLPQPVDDAAGGALPACCLLRCLSR